MNANREDVEIDYTHPSHPSQHTQTGVNNDSSGVGANADTGLAVDMAFLASDPLSELVWTPTKGLSLRRAVRGVLEKTPNLLWGIDPSTVVISSSPSGTSGIKSDGQVQDEKSLPSPPSTIDPVNHDVSEEAESHGGLHYDACIAEPSCPEVGRVSDDEVLRQSIEDMKAAGEVNAHSADKDEKYLRSEPCALRDNSHSHQSNPKKFDSLAVSQVLQPNGPHSFKPYLPPPYGRPHEPLGFQKEKREIEKILPTTITILPLEKVKATDDKDVQILAVNGCGSVKFTNQYHAEEKHLPLNICVASGASPIRAYMHKGKGKEKVLSAGGFSTSDHEDNSRESAESCNSDAFITKGKRRIFGFEERLIDERRNVKRKMEEQPGFSSFNNSGSSFMNWISSMIKGFGKPNEDTVPSASLSLAKTGCRNERQGLISCNIIEDHHDSNFGFDSFFQTLCRSNRKVLEKKILQADKQMGEGCELLKLTKIASYPHCEPIPLRIENPNADRGKLLLNEKVDPSNENDATFLPDLQRDSNRNCCTQASGESNDGVASSRSSQKSSLGKRKVDAGSDSSDIPSEIKKDYSCTNKNNLLSSLWITRFSLKSSCHLANTVQGKQSTMGDVECSLDYHVDSSKVDENSQCGDYATKDQVMAFNKEMQFGLVEKKARHFHSKAEGWKSNPPVPSLRFKSSEAIASVFARRLDALRQILPSDPMEKTVQSMMTCLFCGLRGHHLRDCSQITEADLEELLGNASSYGGTETSLCFCIRCFQLNHWAIACPAVISSSKQSGSSSHTCMFNGNITSELRYARGSDGNLMMENIEDEPQPAVGHTFLHLNSSCSKRPRLSSNPNREMNVAPSSSKRNISLLNSNSVEKVSGPVHGLIASEFPKLTCRHNSVTALTSLPERIFEAVRKLRLSRADVLKWMKSTVQLGNLDGYYLRIRHGNFERLLAGNGYHVACITSTHGEFSPETSEKPICVSVGGTRCSIGSQYISNQDFLEDELIEWWGAITKDGGGIPSEEDLRAKIKERIDVGM